jgi:hypothetical protein
LNGLWLNHGRLHDLGSFTPAAINNGVMVGGQYIDSGGTVQDLSTLIPARSSYQQPGHAADPGLKPAHTAGESPQAAHRNG